MSEQPTAAPPRARGGGGFMTRRMGPFNLPGWIWVGFGAAVLLAVFLIIRQRKQQQGQQQAAGVQCPQGYAPDSQGNCVPVSTTSNAVPQFVNQTYTTLNAPEQETLNVAPGTPGATGPPGPPGPPGPGGPPSPPIPPPPPRASSPIPAGPGVPVQAAAGNVMYGGGALPTTYYAPGLGRGSVVPTSTLPASVQPSQPWLQRARGWFM